MLLGLKKKSFPLKVEEQDEVEQAVGEREFGPAFMESCIAGCFLKGVKNPI